ncbi:MAG: Crp/Fnr family transcriptional regulator [Novosphingobium sp.]
MLECDQCPVRNRAACASLSQEDRQELARAGRTVTLARGETLFAAGESNERCATLISGALKVSQVDASGDEHMLALIHPAGFIGELFTPFATHDVTALTESRLCVFSRSQLNRTMTEHPELAQALLQRAQADVHSARNLLALSNRRSAQSQVAGLVLALGHAASDSPCHSAAQFDLPLTRGEMAELLGLTIETVSRQLSALETKGLLRRKGSRGIELTEPKRLAELAA